MQGSPGPQVCHSIQGHCFKPFFFSGFSLCFFLSQGEPGPPGEAGMEGVPGPKVSFHPH